MVPRKTLAELPVTTKFVAMAPDIDPTISSNVVETEPEDGTKLVSRMTLLAVFATTWLKLQLKAPAAAPIAFETSKLAVAGLKPLKTFELKGVHVAAQD